MVPVKVKAALLADKVNSPSAVIAPIPVRSPVVEISQSEVLILPKSPLSPKVKVPLAVKSPPIKATPVVDKVVRSLAPETLIPDENTPAEVTVND